ncbi:30S ribosomal protein S1 [Bombilactobacillus thymidiniphilus]|uniref:30S ribosomal protein S1 n=1 Tax=Bombilactobacillus thymidiniphilus TaxID=2923363 RepID=A0ABY4PD62_9LACO|nr:30S ribosomal protein S1 [Bombilactobacillus thymidiniphilus]UQS83718.1 30S ribosomal protein S1 [Bombilactobacillus thymidiniphilus]
MAEDNNSINPMEQALDDFDQVQVGDIVTTEVLSVEDGQLIVGIDNSGVEGVVPIKELTADRKANIHDIAKTGDRLELLVTRRSTSDKEDGSFILSKRRIENKKAYEQMAQLMAADQHVEGQVSGTVKSGLLVDVDGLRGFIPASMISDHFVRDLKAYVGKTLELKIVEVDPAKNRFVLSHREIAQAERQQQQAEIMAKILPGDIIEAKVSRLTNFGAFIDLGGMDGLVHVSQISYNHVDKPSDVLKPDQDVKVKVLDVDKEHGRVSLSIKAAQPGPWDTISEKIATGDEVEGTVKRLTDFGAFVEVLPGIEGLVHVSQISWNHIDKPSDVLSVGEKVQLKVLNVEPDKKRLGLSIKALVANPHAKKQDSDTEEKIDYTLPDEERGFSMGDIVQDEADN